jgi:two-component system, sensor histidine kinase and response regulator
VKDKAHSPDHGADQSRSFTPRILIADDNAWDRALLSSSLRRKGNLVRTVARGTEVLEVAARFQPHVVFLDLCTPGLDGWEVCERLRDSEIAGEAAILALMTNAPSDYTARYRRAGFDAYLQKPVELDLASRLVQCSIQ